MIPNKLLEESIYRNVLEALREDVGSGDVSAKLIREGVTSTANIISRENGIFCGKLWVNETAAQLDKKITIDWHVDDGSKMRPNQLLFKLCGPAASLLTAERTILNFCQLLSGTATKANQYSQIVGDSKAKILDTRKTLPGLRIAQKYAVGCGGCNNHRIGLFDAYLIKENHIISLGGIKNAIQTAKKNKPKLKIEIEVEDINELAQAIEAEADIALIDNFSIDETNRAVALAKGKIKLEASGGIDMDSLKAIAETGVDYISIGALTKEVFPIDLSMRFSDQRP